MKISKFVIMGLVLLVSLCVTPVTAWACACCSDENEYGISFRKPHDFERVILGDIKFASSIIRATSPLSDDQEISYALTGGLDGGVWKFLLRDGAQTATLNLTLPPKMLNYVVDPHNGQKSAGGGPLLYKEWRFEGRANATGFLRSSRGVPTSYFLVFQGWGNRCDNAEDFSHWRLELKTARGKLTFNGELARTTARLF